jgi:hypothetical protein
MSEPTVHRMKVAWLFGGIGAVCGSIGCAFLGYMTGRSDWSPPLDPGDMRVFVALSAVTGLIPGAFTGLALWVATMRGVPLAPRMLTWGVIGGWLVLLFFFASCFHQSPGIGGPVFFRRDVGGFCDRLVAAVLVPLVFGMWIFAVLGAIGGAVAALGWSRGKCRGRENRLAAARACGSFGVDTRGIGERSHSGMTAWRRLHCSYRLKITAPVCASIM